MHNIQVEHWKTWARDSARNQVTWAWFLWVLFIFFVVIKKGLDPLDYENTFLLYRDAAVHWLNAQPLYDGSHHGFIYLPQSALLFTPFTLLSAFLGSLLWRLLSIGVFALGVFAFSKLASRRYQSQLFLPVTIVSILMSVTVAKAGQATVIMAGMMMLAMIDLVEENPWRAAGWLVLSFALKPLSVVLILLVAVLYPKARAPLAVAFTALFLVPLALQDPSYVWEQYTINLTTIAHIAEETEETQRKPFAQLFWMLRSAGLDTPDTVQFLIRTLFAALTLGFCWWLRGKQTPHTFAIYLYTLALCYLMLFNTRTENNTYAMLGPALAVFTVWAFQSARYLWGYAYLAITIMFIMSYRLGKWLTGDPTIWIKPLLCTAFVVLVLSQSHLDHDNSQNRAIT